MEHYIRVYENVLTKEFCDHVISMFEKDPNKQTGKTIYGEAPNKRTTDLSCSQQTPEWIAINKTLFDSLNQSLNKYFDEFAENFEGYTPSIGDTGYKMMKYEPVTGGFDTHTDVNGLSSSRRFLTGLWYLNDVEKGGETIFHKQDVTIKPKAGNLVLFPPFFTHPHKGCATETSKYVINTFIIFTGS